MPMRKECYHNKTLVATTVGIHDTSIIHIYIYIYYYNNYFYSVHIRVISTLPGYSQLLMFL